MLARPRRLLHQGQVVARRDPPRDGGMPQVEYGRGGDARSSFARATAF